jgi:DNA polymerase-3 subunit gamma/tau
VLSRCQRFDLRRVEAGVLVAHLEGICARENVTAEAEALALIARASEGSVRDSLSLLDQAIADAGRELRAEDVRRMLGLADRTRVIDLFEALMRGDMATALTELRDQYDSGADPAVVLTDLAEFTHFVTRMKVVPAVADDPALAEAERTRGRSLAASLSMRVLSRTWQMLLKGLGEVKEAGKPLAAAEMVLVRIAYAADLPTPDEVMRALNGGAAPAGAPEPNGGPRPGGGNGPRAELSRSAPRASLAPAQLVTVQVPDFTPPRAQRNAEPSLVLRSFEELIRLAAEKRDLVTKSALERDVRLVNFEDGRLELALERSARPTLVNDLSRKLAEWTGKRWMVSVSSEQGAPTVQAQAQARNDEMMRGVQADPLVQAVLTRFPGAEIVGVRRRDDALPPTDGVPPVEDDSAFGEQAPDDFDDDL